MSENSPSTSSGTKLSLCSPKTSPRKTRRKAGNVKLPTPPPDPREKEEKSKNCTENEFLEYLEHLQKHTANYSRSTSTLASALVTEDAFDHLEKLYKLMEQMLELRSQNAKLHRKIRDLEHLNNLQKMYKKVEESAAGEICPELDKDTAFAETILESILYEPKILPKNKASFRQSLMRKHRNRSSSAVDKPVGLDTVETSDHRRASLCTSPTKKSSKVSKWTKVKAAFKWEKASTTVGDAKSLDSGISGIAPMEIARYLRVPSNEDAGHSHSDSGAAEISTPGSLSSASSNENFHKTDHRCLYDDLRSSDDEHHNSLPHSKEDPSVSPRSSQRSHRTPWTRMKDMINTRNPVRKKSRMSTNSDDVQIDIELCSDNEEVFEDNSKHISPPTPDVSSTTKFSFDNVVPNEVMERYKSNEEHFKDSDCSESTSRWTRVKKAFLPNLELRTNSPYDRNREVMSEREIIQSEINNNYRNLQKKLSIEFQEKLSEWKRIKQNANTGSSPTPSCSTAEETPTCNVFLKKMEEWEKIKSQPTATKSNIQMTNEENLPPEFKKKLKEWEIMKRSSISKNTKKPIELPRWKSLQSGKTPQNPHIEIPIISEEFKKKLEDWKQIKSKNNDSEGKNTGNKTPSPKLFHADSKVKQQEEKEIHWYEKELNKIEKEKCRLEKERLKFMEREERLSKLRRSVTGGHKRDILVHTPSGFYKFEGISRKFTQKLYEWEKSRGIRPESSTFAFLNEDRPQFSIPKVKINGKDHTPPLTRSRSVDSMAISTLNAECPLTSQPSSLSLNDVDNFEKKCLSESKVSSLEYLAYSETDAEEPEAIIVEVEDFVEETAAPLKSYIEQHSAVYQREEMRALCEGETCLAPKIRRSESARAQNNYNLIEDALSFLRLLWENETDIRNYGKKGHSIRTEDPSEEKIFLIDQLIKKVQKLQEENSIVVLNLTKEKKDNESSNHLLEILEIVQDLSAEISLKVEELGIMIRNRSDECQQPQMDNDLFQRTIKETRVKLLDLRRHLSYVCAVSDTTTPIKQRMKSVIREKLSNDSQGTSSDLSYKSSYKDENENSKSEIYEKNSQKHSSNHGAIKKRLRYRVENSRRKSITNSDDENDIGATDQRKNSIVFRTRTISDTSSKHEVKLGDENSKIFPVVSKTTYSDSPAKINASDSPVTIFVKTTRKLFTPFIEINLKENENVEQPSNVEIDDIQKKQTIEDEGNGIFIDNDNSEQFGVVGLPPLPSSPTPQKKYMKDMSPSIRIMLAKYNQKISEQDLITRSGGSSGSASPVAWRSPTAERRVKAQTEKYQEEISKAFPFKREVQKSASQGVIRSSSKDPIVKNSPVKVSESETNSNCRNIMKSSSATTIFRRKEDDNMRTPTESIVKQNFSKGLECERILDYKIASELRLQKLKKAKEDFLNSGPYPIHPSDTKSETHIQYSRRNRLSQISVESNSSASSTTPGFLVKSISAGMINISEEAYRKLGEESFRPYVSLPRTMKPAERKSAFNQIASKFRRIRMKKGKEREKDKFSTVSELCRQSLIVDINETNNSSSNACSSVCRGSSFNGSQDRIASISKSSSWIQKANFFRK